jgi:hypothetical protein
MCALRVCTPPGVVRPPRPVRWEGWDGAPHQDRWPGRESRGPGPRLVLRGGHVELHHPERPKDGQVHAGLTAKPYGVPSEVVPGGLGLLGPDLAVRGQLDRPTGQHVAGASRDGGGDRHRDTPRATGRAVHRHPGPGALGVQYVGPEFRPVVSMASHVVGFTANTDGWNPSNSVREYWAEETVAEGEIELWLGHSFGPGNVRSSVGSHHERADMPTVQTWISASLLVAATLSE